MRAEERDSADVPQACGQRERHRPAEAVDDLGDRVVVGVGRGDAGPFGVGEPPAGQVAEPLADPVGVERDPAHGFLSDGSRVLGERGGQVVVAAQVVPHADVVSGLSFEGPWWADGVDTLHPVYADPLCIPPARYFLRSYLEWRDDDGETPWWFDFAPDELHKADVSGATFDIALPDTRVDPVLTGVENRAGVTLVDYLRVSFAWGGFPGYELADAPPPPWLGHLREDLIDF